MAQGYPADGTPRPRADRRGARAVAGDLQDVPAYLWRSNSLAGALAEEAAAGIARLTDHVGAAGESRRRSWLSRAASAGRAPAARLRARLRRSSSQTAVGTGEERAPMQLTVARPHDVQEFVCKPRAATRSRPSSPEVVASEAQSTNRGSSTVPATHAVPAETGPEAGETAKQSATQAPGAVDTAVGPQSADLGAAPGAPQHRGGIAIDVDFGPKARGRKPPLLGQRRRAADAPAAAHTPQSSTSADTGASSSSSSSAPSSQGSSPGSSAASAVAAAALPGAAREAGEAGGEAAAPARGGIVIDVDFGPKPRGRKPILSGRGGKAAATPPSRASPAAGDCGAAVAPSATSSSEGTTTLAAPVAAASAEPGQQPLEAAAVEADAGRAQGSGAPPEAAVAAAVAGVDRAQEAAVAPRGGIALDLDFGPSAGRRPPRAVAARLSGGRPKASAKAAAAAAPAGGGGTSQPTAKESAPKKPAPVSAFIDATSPIDLLAEHDCLDFGDDPQQLLQHATTTQEVRQLCADVRKLGAEGLKKLLAWRAALLHERRTGALPSEAELAELCREEAASEQRRRGASAPVAEGVAASADVSENVTGAPRPAQISTQARGLDEAMSKAVAERATEEDSEVIERLRGEIEELSQALKAPGVTAVQACKIRKELGKKRSERARAERAIRQGRRAQHEVKGSPEEVRAMLSGLAAPGGQPGGGGGGVPDEGPPRFLGEGTPQPTPSEAAGRKRGLPPGLGKGEAPPTVGSQEMALAVLLHPEVLSAGGCAAVGRVGLLAKAFKAVALDGSSVCFGDMAWRIACMSLAHECALWCPESVESSHGHWRTMFFEQLWPARWKWAAAEGAAEGAARQRRLGELGVVEDETGRDFAIQVAVRFRPGATSQGRLFVPLHQKLMLERGKADGLAKIGEKEPPEFLDALMGHVMADPVRLPSSGRICDRRVVEEQLKRSPADPFDGSHLEAHMLEPQEELRTRIEGWRAERRRQAGDACEKHKLDEKEVQELVGRLGGAVDLEVVQAVLEAERLRAAGRALRGSERRREEAEEEDDAQEDQPEGETAEEAAAAAADAAGLEPGLRDIPLAGPRAVATRTAEAMEEELGEAAKREGPRVLAVSPPTKIAMYNPGVGVRPYVFARVFDEDASQEQVYKRTCQASVCAALNGFNACLICYGQTGAGKTHTMFGQSVAMGGNAGAVVSQQSGCVIRALRDLFDAAGTMEARSGVITTVVAQYVQVYQDQVTCLQTGEPVALREVAVGAPVLLQGAAEAPVQNTLDAAELLAKGEERKRYAETAMNHRSSRAHTVLVLKISQARGDLQVQSQLHLVDLAGSERVKKSRAQGGRLVEAVGINSSLMVLGMCIAARVKAKRHVPYYESRLTLLLRSALGGDSRTSVVVCCHKDDTHGDETLQALNFGERCSMVTNRAQAAMASSTTGALAAVDAALEECAAQVRSLEQRGKGGLPACRRLQAKRTALQQKRRELAERLGPQEPEQGSCPA